MELPEDESWAAIVDMDNAGADEKSLVTPVRLSADTGKPLDHIRDPPSAGSCRRRELFAMTDLPSYACDCSCVSVYIFPRHAFHADDYITRLIKKGTYTFM